MQLDLSTQFSIKSLVSSALFYSGELQGKDCAGSILLQLEQLSVQIATRCCLLDSASQKRAEFHRFFYQELGFTLNTQNCLSSQNGLLDKVWESRCGVPLSVAMLYLYLSKECELESFPVAFPGHFLLGVEDERSATYYLDPLTGEQMPESVLSGILRGNKGNLATLQPTDLLPAREKQVLRRLFSGLKAAFIREDKPEQALRCCDWLLEIDSDDPFGIRDRGFLLQQLECYTLAAKDLEYFLNKCPDHKSAPLIKLQLKSLQQQTITLH